MLALASIVSPSRDADFINSVVNDPDVRPFVGGEGELDLSPLMANSHNVFLMGDHGGFALIWTAPRTFEVHTFILKAGRGHWARAAVNAMVRYMREHGAKRLWTQINATQPNVIAYAVEAGMCPTGEELQTFGERHIVFEMEP